MENNNSNSKFNRLTGFFPNKSGSGLSVGVTEDIVQALAGIEVGDRIFLGGVDSERPWISYAKADPAFQKKSEAAERTPAERPTPASVVKKPNRVEKF